jgi:hypothetical protein
MTNPCLSRPPVMLLEIVLNLDTTVESILAASVVVLQEGEARRAPVGNFYKDISMHSLTRSLSSVNAKRLKRECPHWRTTKRGCQRSLTAQATTNIW